MPWRRVAACSVEACWSPAPPVGPATSRSSSRASPAPGWWPSLRREEHERLVREAGAHEIAIGEDAESAGAFGTYHLILESVGGKILGDVIGMLAPGGMCVSFGVSGGRRQRSTFGASIPRAGRSCTVLYSSTRC